MKSGFKAILVTYLTIYSYLVFSPVAVSHPDCIRAGVSADATPIIGTIKSQSLPVNYNTATDLAFGKPLRVTVNNIPVLPRPVSDRKLYSYFLSHDIFTNLPSIQYKFPLSEHTEAG